MNKYNILLVFILIIAVFLRIWRIDSVPVSLFGDELDVGYHAYSILKTGKDYSGNFALFYVKSLADKKAPLYSYLIVPSVAIFGITPNGVRLPAAFFGVLGVLFFYLVIKLLTNNKNIALLSALLMCFSPWHIHYSRWGFEGTLMVWLYLVGFYSLLKSFSNNKWLLLSSLAFSLTTFAYHAAKIFLPITLFIILIIWWKQITKISKKYLVAATVLLLIIAGSLGLNTILGGSAERFQSLSIFNNPTNIGEIGFGRDRDMQMGVGLFSHLFHNKWTLLFSKISNNYLESFSTKFLFIRGDTNPRHSILQNGEFYKYQFFFLILGLMFFAIKHIDKRCKAFIVCWVLVAPFPSMITDGGGNHASRLLFLLPPLVFLIALGMYYPYFYLGRILQRVYLFSVVFIFITSFVFYEHNYFIHYPWDSERLWQAGFSQAIKSVVSEGERYDKVIISGADEPPLIFFLAWSQYPPASFQHKYPLVKINLGELGEVSQLDKYYFPPVGKERGLYELGSVLPGRSLYLATIKEIKLDLIKEPGRVPDNLILIKSIAYPSGEPAFYLFAKNEKFNKT